MRCKKYNLEGKKHVNLTDGTPITSFVMREISGVDEESAAKTAKARGEGVAVLQEMIRLAFVEVNGEPVNVGKPYLAFDLWNAKARSYAITAYRDLNMTTDKDDEDFLAAAEDYEPGTPAAP